MIANIDKIDKRILGILQKNCRTSIAEISKILKIPKSTVQYRIKKLEAEEIIEGYYAKINSAKIGKNYITITFVRVKCGKKYYDKVGNSIAQIPGVYGVYFIAGENDFIVISASSNQERYLEKLESLYQLEGFERASTMVVMKTIKDDSTLNLGVSE